MTSILWHRREQFATACVDTILHEARRGIPMSFVSANPLHKFMAQYVI